MLHVQQPECNELPALRLHFLDLKPVFWKDGEIVHITVVMLVRKSLVQQGLSMHLQYTHRIGFRRGRYVNETTPE